MSAVHLDLDGLEPSEGPTVTFTLDGRDWVCKTRGEIPALIVDGLLGAMPMRLDVLYRGLLASTVERDGEQVDQGAEFVALLARPDSPLTLDRARRLAEAVAEAVLNRPTVPSARSPRGRQTTAATSKAASSSRGGRSKKRAS